MREYELHVAVSPDLFLAYYILQQCCGDADVAIRRQQAQRFDVDLVVDWAGVLLRGGGLGVGLERAPDPADRCWGRGRGVGSGVEGNAGDGRGGRVGDGVVVEAVWVFDGEQGRGQTLEGR